MSCTEGRHVEASPSQNPIPYVSNKAVNVYAYQANVAGIGQLRDTDPVLIDSVYV